MLGADGYDDVFGRSWGRRTLGAFLKNESTQATKWEINRSS